MKTIEVSARLSDDEAAALKDTHLGEEAISDFQIFTAQDGPVTIRRPHRHEPNRKLTLATFLPGWTPGNHCKAAFDVGQRIRLPNGESTRSQWGRTIGYMDRQGGLNPVCRATEFNLKHPHEFRRLKPFIRAHDRAFQKYAEEEYWAQRKAIQAMPSGSAYVIDDTAFTTVTVNPTYATPVHRDKGNFQGMGVLGVVRGGDFTGGFLTFVQWGVAFDLRTGDVLLADFDEWHGNTPLVGTPGEFLRLAFVFYMRERVQKCRSKEEENRRARRVSPEAYQGI